MINLVIRKYSEIALLIKNLLGINDFSLLMKNIHKRVGKMFYYKKYTADAIVAVMQSMGMKEGALVCIHSSMKEFYNYKGTARELIEKIIDVIGPNGTLMMPAFPDYSLLTDDYIFDKINDKTGAGYMSEEFRKYPGVMRSINVTHSVCAIGPLTDYLLSEHHKGTNCWDEFSPWYRLCEMDGLVFNIGMPRNYISTFEHCVESVLQYEHPYWAQFFTRKKEYRYYNDAGGVEIYTNMINEIERRTRESKIFKWLTSNDWKYEKISNLEIKVFYSKNCLRKMICLGRLGVSLYWMPSTNEYIF
jgi:aminoglycoside 3-N-acetyltransferase